MVLAREAIKVFRKFKTKTYKREFISGESFLYLGRQYKMVIKRARIESVSLVKSVLTIYTTKKVSDSLHNKKILNSWLESRTSSVFLKRFELMLHRFTYKDSPQLKTREMQRRWGSFLNKEKIFLNPKLIHASKECIDYVIVHELCHLKYKNHDKNFWRLFEQKYPKWQKVKDKLEMYNI